MLGTSFSQLLAVSICSSGRWSTGQDQVRIIKQRLIELVPLLRCFLDVDDLDDLNDLEACVSASRYIVIFLSAGYFGSANVS